MRVPSLHRYILKSGSSMPQEKKAGKTQNLVPRSHEYEYIIIRQLRIGLSISIDRISINSNTFLCDGWIIVSQLPPK